MELETWLGRLGSTGRNGCAHPAVIGVGPPNDQTDDAGHRRSSTNPSTAGCLGFVTNPAALGILIRVTRRSCSITFPAFWRGGYNRHACMDQMCPAIANGEARLRNRRTELMSSCGSSHAMCRFQQAHTRRKRPELVGFARPTLNREPRVSRALPAGRRSPMSD